MSNDAPTSIERESDATYRALFDRLDEGFCVVEVMFDADRRPLDYRFLDVNAAFERESGMHGALGRTLKEVVPAVGQEWIDAVGGVALTGESLHLVQQARSTGNWFEIHAFRFNAARPHAVALRFHNVTWRQQAEAALRDSEQRFRDLAEAMPQMVYVLDANLKIEYLSRQWYDFTGRPPGTGEDIGEWSHPQDTEGMVAAWREAVQRGETVVCQHRLKRHDGEYRWFLTRAVPRRDAQGRVQRWYGTTTEVHEQVMLAQALKEADRRKDEFIAMLAHELRNPMAPIQNAVSILRLADDQPAVRHKAQDMLERQVLHLRRLVDDLLDVSRITAGKIALDRRPVDLLQVVREGVDAQGPALRAAGLDCETVLPTQPLWVQGDPVRLAQIVANLLGNAIKYGIGGAQIRVQVSTERDDAVLTVEDHGQGIAPEMLPRVFDLFVQADPAPGGQRGGLGIGLALVRQLVSLHGGEVRGASEGLGKGSTFVVRLPLARDLPGAAPPGAAAASGEPGLHVLVVDDNRDAAHSLAELLVLLGAVPQVVYDGQAALDAFAAHRPPVVVMDIGMPVMDGHEAARRMRVLPGGGDALLVALSGWGQDEDQRRSRAAGFDLHWTKPVEIDQVRLLLQRGTAAGR
jgi:PAS domain S-box-containing protein